MSEVFFPALCAALVAKWRADPTLAAANVKVYDGPPTNQPDAGRHELFVGASGLDFGDTDDAGTTEQEWANATTTERDSFETVVCGLWLSKGSTDMGVLREAVSGLLVAIAAGLRADLTLGIPGVFWVELGNVVWRQIQATQGASFGCTFTVRARCRAGLQ